MTKIEENAADVQSAASEEFSAAVDASQIEKIKALELERTELQQQLKQQEDKLLRMAAELENTRQRQSRELEKAHKFALDGFVEDLLPVFDCLDGAMQGKDDEGLDMMMAILLKALAKHGVAKVDPIDQPFNADEHEAIAVEQSDAQADTVIKVLQKGFTLNGRLIRPALVVVSKSDA